MLQIVTRSVNSKFEVGSQRVVCKTLLKLYECCFVRLYANYSLFTYKNVGKFMVLLVYVDDLVLIGNDSDTCSVFKTYLNNCCCIKNLGPLKYFFEIEMARDSHGLFLL